MPENELFQAIRCEAFIAVRCLSMPEPTDSVLSPRGYPSVFVDVADGPRAPLVGNLTAHVNPFPIYAKNSPWQTLKLDLSKILEAHGYSIAGHPDKAVYRLVGDVTFLDVRSRTGWLEGTTHAEARFTVDLTGQGEEPARHLGFTGEYEEKFSYAYLSDYESILGKAYCHALEDFASAITHDLTQGLLRNKSD
ncbi:hypothetical protein [Marinobacter sp. CHS3-4]|uniref:hypothetical protein n=1 Tax=Marinobacter sp. CHS3-4 TaxID=3045174 RepID=UPI0024B5A714|nr:hypothetical protein [Marinobacter sp. CHS3-4]MDI9246570.1 hypothetical protein [Marinobacter sp. CHS3-4]